ncbi:MAG: pyrroline-5-carboxylate reductase [Desulfobacterales bacterium]|nr:MAG: pyrroline-5-carboxylate reductase [Desulfobacterales bacterium]
MIRNIAFIGGGQMAEAFISGILNTKKIPAHQIRVVEPVEQRREYLGKTYGISVSTDLPTFVSKSDVIILAVKPQVITTALAALKPVIGSQLLISIAAGITIDFLETGLGKKDGSIIRVMPNTPALVQSAATALCRNKNVSDEDLDFAVRLFNTIGKTVITEERMIDGITGLSGSGPAYVFAFIDALIDAGVKTGLDRRTARKLTIQTVIGSARLLEHTGVHPVELKERVTTPGGTTAYGLHVLDRSGFKGNIISAVEAATQRSIELGKKDA